MRPVRKPRHWWKGMPNDVPGREAERRSPVSSRRSESKRSEGPRPVGLCLLSSTLVKIFFQFPLCFLGFSLSPPFMLHHSLLRPCDKFSIIRDRSRVLGKDRLIPSGLQTSTNLVVKFSLFPRIVNKTRIVFRARVENIDTDDSCGE